MPQTLEYAAPRDAVAPWGPLLVRPSRRTIVLFLLTAAVAAWVGFRHEPWVLTATVNAPPNLRPVRQGAPSLYLQDDYLLTHDQDVREIRVWDPVTGRSIRTIGQETGPDPKFPVGYYVVDRGRYILVRSLGRSTADLLDPLTGTAVQRASRLPPPGRVLDVSAGIDPVVLYAQETTVAGGKLDRATIGLWRSFDAGAKNPLGTFQIPGLRTARFSPDARTVAFTFDEAIPQPATLTAQQRLSWQLQVGPGPFATRRARLYEVASGNLLADLPNRVAVTEPQFSDDGEFLITNYDPNPPAPPANVLPPGFPPSARFRAPIAAPATAAGVTIERHSTRTGKLMSSTPLPTGVDFVLPFADGAHALVDPDSLLGTGGAGRSSIVDLRGPVGATRRSAWDGAFVHFAAPFPDGRRMVIADGSRLNAGIYDTDGGQPLAVLARGTGGVGQAQVSPTGRRIAAQTGGSVRIYEEVGLECRESHFGVLGMPHVMLLGALLVGLAASLRVDARRSPSAAYLSPATAMLASAMLVLALPRTFHAILAAVTGELLYTTAPLVLVCAIGLASGARAWRLITLVVLAGVLSVGAYCTFDLRHAGLALPYRLEVIDRTFELPRRAVLGLMALLTLLTVPAVIQLIRPPRSSD